MTRLGLPLPGVTVQVKGTENLGAVTNFDGEFSIVIDTSKNKFLFFLTLDFKRLS